VILDVVILKCEECGKFIGRPTYLSEFGPVVIEHFCGDCYSPSPADEDLPELSQWEMTL